MIYFDDLQVSNSDIALSIGDAVREMLGVAGIHETLTDQRTLASSSDMVTVTGNTFTWAYAGVFRVADCQGNVATEVTLPVGARLLAGADDGAGQPSIFLGVGIESDAITFWCDNTIISRFPKPTGATVFRVAFTEVRNYKLETEYHVITVHVGDRFVGIASTVAHAGSNMLDSLYFDGYGVGCVCVMNDLDDIGNIADYGTIDPGEPVSAGLSRILIGLIPIIFSRHDGSVRVFVRNRYAAAIASLTPYLAEATRLDTARNYRALRAIVRAVTAYPEAEYLGQHAADLHGGFQIVQNPNVLTFNGAYIVARRDQRKSGDDFKPFSYQGPAPLLFEPGDTVTDSNGVRVVIETMDVAIAPNGALMGGLGGYYVWLYE